MDRTEDPMAEDRIPESASAAAAASRLLGLAPAPGLVLGGVVGLQCGAALSVGLFARVGPAGVVLLRLALAALLLGALWRPRLRLDRRTLATVLAAGTLLAVHHLSYYEAVGRIPLGAATTVEFLGPFAIALAGSRRPVDLLWSLLAATGVLLLGAGGTALDPVGLGFAALAGACWAATSWSPPGSPDPSRVAADWRSPWPGAPCSACPTAWSGPDGSCSTRGCCCSR